MKFGKKFTTVIFVLIVSSILLGSLLVSAAPEDPGAGTGVGDYDARIAELEAEIVELTILAGTNRELLDFLEEQWIPGPAGPQGDPGPARPRGDPGVGFGTAGNISVPAAQFIPYQNFDYENHGYFLVNTDAIPQHFVAAVQLPHGALITKVIFKYGDYGPLEMILTLKKADQTIVTLESIGDTGYGYTTATPPEPNYVDNNNYSYYLDLYIPSIIYNLHEVFIEYNLDT
jgi:hypothetical protein